MTQSEGGSQTRHRKGGAWRKSFEKGPDVGGGEAIHDFAWGPAENHCSGKLLAAIAKDRWRRDRRQRKQTEEGKPFSGANNIRVFSRT